MGEINGGGHRWSRPVWLHREGSRGCPGAGPHIGQRRAGSQPDTHNRGILSMGGGGFLSGPQGSRARQWLPKEAIGALYKKKKHLFKVSSLEWLYSTRWSWAGPFSSPCGMVTLFEWEKQGKLIFFFFLALLSLFPRVFCSVSACCGVRGLSNAELTGRTLRECPQQLHFCLGCL